MASTTDLYEILGVPRDANAEDLKRAYRGLAREHHPDVNSSPEAETKFKEISGAYEILSDPSKRQQYDTFGAVGNGRGSGGAGPGGFGDLNDIFDFFFSGGGRGGQARGRQRPSRTQRGEALGATLTLSFEEAAFGATKDVTVEAYAPCETCDSTGCAPDTSTTTCRSCEGRGEVQSRQQSIFGMVMTSHPCVACQGSGQEVLSPCEECRGAGRLPKTRVVTIEVPPGVAGGMELRVTGAGHAGRAGGPPGDLYASLDVLPHEVFERHGQDLHAILELTMTQAALGTDVDVDTLDGPERVKLDRGVQSGEVVRLKAKGLPNIERRGRGDLFLSVHVRTPEDVSREERKLLEELADIRGEETKKGARGSLKRPPEAR